MRKKGFRRFVPWIVLGAVALVLGILPALARSAVTGSEASVLSATAETGVIENTLAGGGTLTADKPIEVKVPSTVEITEFLVENGDRVEEEQPLAKVDRVTLLGAMTEVQKSLEEIALQMQNKANAYTAAKLTSQVNGRVKALFAKVGDDVKQVMLKHGAVAVVSVDGLMVTEVRTSLPVQAGQAVTVRLSEGKEVPGRVETAQDGALLVTLSDDGPQLGDAVTVLTKEGEEIGRGSLAVHSPWNLLATDGTVSFVYVRENQTIWLGNGIVSVEKLTGNAEYQALAAKHRKYEELLQEMFAFYSDDTVKAPSAGFVSGVDEKMIKNTAAWDRDYQITLLSSENTDAGQTAETAPATVSMLVTGVNGNIVSGVAYSDGMDIASLQGLLALLAGGNEAIVITDGNIPNAGDIITAQINENHEGSVVDTIGHVDIDGLMNDTAKPTPSIPPMPNINIDIGSLIGGFSFPSGGFSMPSSAGGGTGEEDDGLYDLEEKTVLSITPDNSMTVSIRVDELDILQYEPGMEADVTVDALPDRSFTAQVTEIGAMGENAGGSSKYTVKLRLDRAPDMLDGMNASVVVHRGTRSGLLLPAAAIHDRGSRSFVYTALDGKTGKPALETPVTTGISDGERVEILSGVSEGQTVYYEYYLPKENSPNPIP